MKRVKILITTLIMTMALSTTAFASPISTVNTFDGDKGEDVVTEADGTELQYYKDVYGNVFNSIPMITKTVKQGETGNTLRYDLNLLGGQKTNNLNIRDTTYMTVNNIERESGFGIERLLYSHNPVTVTMQGTQLFKCKEILKAPKYVMDSGNLAYVELTSDTSKYQVSTLDTGLSTYELKEPGLYFIMFDKVDSYGREKGIHLYVYIAQPNENITNTVTSNIAVPTTVNFNVNGNNTSVPMYSLNGGSYIRVRDLAYILKDTSKKLSVYYNTGTDTTTVNTHGGLGNPNNDYIENGTELSALETGTIQAEPSVHNLVKNGSIIKPAIYTISGQDFVDLKALASILNLDMTVNSDGIVIDTDKVSSNTPMVVLLNSTENSTDYANHSDYAKILGYPTIDCANKSNAQILAELGQIEGLTKVYVAFKSLSALDLRIALRSKYTVG